MWVYPMVSLEVGAALQALMLFSDLYPGLRLRLRPGLGWGGPLGLYIAPLQADNFEGLRLCLY
jgi:hypothetical protein